MAFKDRMLYITDPNFAPIPVEMLISREYAAKARALIDSGEDRRVVAEASPVPANTTTLSVMDGDGNAVGLNHSINTGAAVVTPGLGFLHNNRMWGFNPQPGHRDSIAPGKAPHQGGGPCVLLQDGQVRLVIGSPGGARGTTSAVQAVANVLHFGMGLQQAVEVPRIHSEDEAATIHVDPDGRLEGGTDPRGGAGLAVVE
jgi:gamma-glutamyltranspeptidase/glutathione hydrolase